MRLAWDLPAAPVDLWEVSYSTARAGPVVESAPPLVATAPTIDVTGLQEGVRHLFFVRSRSASGLAAAATAAATPVELPGQVARIPLPPSLPY